MVRVSTAWIVAVLVAALASPAVEVAAFDLPARATIGIAIPTLPVFQMNSSGTVVANPAEAGAHLRSLSVGAGFASQVTTIPVTDPVAFPIRGLKFTAANAAGLLGESAGGRFNGLMPVLGVAKVCLFATCGTAVANVVVPLSVIGEGGAVAVEGPVNVTVRGAPWTTGTIVAGSATAAGGRAGPAGAPSSTAQIGGRLNLVTPIYISTNMGALPQIDSIGRVSMRFEGDPLCDVEVDAGAYRDGDTIAVTRLRFATQQGSAHEYRIRVYFRVPIGSGVEVSALDQVGTPDAAFDRDLAPFSAFQVFQALPRGAYRFGCSLTDTRTGELHGDEATFAIE